MLLYLFFDWNIFWSFFFKIFLGVLRVDVRRRSDINPNWKKENEEKGEAEEEESVSLPSRQDPLSILESAICLYIRVTIKRWDNAAVHGYVTLSPYYRNLRQCMKIRQTNRPSQVLKLYLRSILLWSIEFFFSVHCLLLCFYCGIKQKWVKFICVIEYYITLYIV